MTCNRWQKIRKPGLSPTLFLAADWGISRLRLFLCQFSGAGPVKVKEQRSSPGIAKTKSPEATLFNEAADWFSRYQGLPIILSGMVGSSIGWRETPYQQCPIRASAIAHALTIFTCRGHTVAIVQGLACTNLLGQPDLMRGEETQIFGWFLQSVQHQNGTHLLCLPGTHSKWLVIKNGEIEDFVTGFTGELYDLLSTHSTLLAHLNMHEVDHTEFQLGVAAAQQAAHPQLLHLLFSVRSRQVHQHKNPEQAAAFLSGLLIGSDVRGMADLYMPQIPQKLADLPVAVIGDTRLSSYYALALKSFGFQAKTFDTEKICLQAYRVIAGHLIDEPRK